MTTSCHSVGDILDNLEDLASGADTVSVGAMMDAFGSRTFGPAIIVPALLEVTPVGAIPGIPTFLAAIIALVAVQKMLGKEHLWIPGFIERRCISADKLAKGADKLRPLARFMDRHFHRRWQRLTHAPFSRIAAGIVVLLCASVPFLEVVPFASSVPMLVIAGFGVAILARDGVLLAVALAASLAVAGAAGADYLDGGLSDTEAVDGVVKQGDVDAARETAEETGEAIEQTAETVGEETQAAAEEAADEIERGAQEAGDRVKESMGGE